MIEQFSSFLLEHHVLRPTQASTQPHSSPAPFDTRVSGRRNTRPIRAPTSFTFTFKYGGETAEVAARETVAETDGIL